MMDEEPEKLETYMEMFVDLQLKVHSQKVNTIKRLRHKLMDQINSLKDLDATARYELATRLESMPKHTKLCHGDFNPTNVIVDKYNKMWIIDWAHAAQGNASADAAMTYLLFSLEDHNRAELYMKLFCEKSDTARLSVCEPLASHRGSSPADQEEGKRKRVPDEVDRRSRVRIKHVLKTK